MIDEKIKKKLSSLLANVSSEKLESITDMIKNNENIESKVDMDKVSKLLKSFDLDGDRADELIAKAKDELKKNPDILSEIK